MLLLCDVGNTNVVVGLASGDRLVRHWRLTTRTERTPDEWRIALSSLLAEADVGLHGIDGAAIASVVPGVAAGLRKALEVLLAGRAVRSLTAETSPIRLAVDAPASVGADRIANCIAGFARYGGPLLILDFGTAVTFDLVGADGTFLGGAIAPEMETAAAGLFAAADQLRPIPLDPPPSVIGRTTAECVRSGVVLGYIDLVRGMIGRFRAEVGAELRVIATGGRGARYRTSIGEIDEYDPTLTLDGLRIAWDRWTSAGRGEAR